MTVYADLNYYETRFPPCRTVHVPDVLFSFYASKASMEIDRRTFGNIQANNIPDEVRMCCCELAEKLYAADQEMKEHEGLTAESVGGWSKHFESGEQRKERLASELRSIVRNWLANTGLLYGGVAK